MKNCKIIEKSIIYGKVEFGILTKDQWIDISSKKDIFINTTDFDNQPECYRGYGTWFSCSHYKCRWIAVSS